MNRQPFELVTHLRFDIETMARAMNCSGNSIKKIFKEGSGTHKVYQYMLADKLKMRVDPGNFALTDGRRHYALRMLHRDGVSFAKSVQIGAGRRFRKNEFELYLSGITGFLIIDTSTFPHARVEYLDATTVSQLHDQSIIGQNGRMSRINYEIESGKYAEMAA